MEGSRVGPGLFCPLSPDDRDSIKNEVPTMEEESDIRYFAEGSK